MYCQCSSRVILWVSQQFGARLTPTTVAGSIYLHQAPNKVGGDASLSRHQTLSEFGETAISHNSQRCMDFLADTCWECYHTPSRLSLRWVGWGPGYRSTEFPHLTLMSPVSLSLYWSPVTQPSSSCKLVTVPSMNVTLGGAINPLETSPPQVSKAQVNKLEIIQ